MVKRNTKVVKSLRGLETNVMKVELNNLSLPIKGCVKGMKQEHTLAMLMKQYVSNIEYL